jgi:hypothetical protein
MYTFPIRRFLFIPRRHGDWWGHFGDHLPGRLL